MKADAEAQKSALEELGKVKESIEKAKADTENKTKDLENQLSVTQKEKEQQ